MTLVLDRAPRASIDFAGLRRGLFGSVLNLAITAGFLALILSGVLPVLRWATIDATWTGTAKDCAAGQGACWAFIVEKARFILLGFYPREADWQATATVVLFAVLMVVTALPRFWHPRLIAAWAVAIPGAVVLMSGLLTGRPVPTQQWGGLPLTLLIAITGFAAAFPLGIALALGRRSHFALVRLVCTAFIEVLRGVPLVAVLYASTLLVPLMLPAGTNLDKLLRAEIGIILFASAYLAEIVRAGLQAVPSGQSAAASALGLTWWQSMRFVILPQALRTVIPSFVTLGIGLFLDTTLVIVIGLFDFLNTATAAASDLTWLGFYTEAFAFAAAIYFAVSFAASRYSLWLERRVGANHATRG
jgi:general L-amino acid transport system permease protein